MLCEAAIDLAGMPALRRLSVLAVCAAVLFKFFLCNAYTWSKSFLNCDCDCEEFNCWADRPVAVELPFLEPVFFLVKEAWATWSSPLGDEQGETTREHGVVLEMACLPGRGAFVLYYFYISSSLTKSNGFLDTDMVSF